MRALACMHAWVCVCVCVCKRGQPELYVVREDKMCECVCEPERDREGKKRRRSEMRRTGWKEEKENGVMLCVYTRACMCVCAW